MEESHGNPHAADGGSWHHGANTVSPDGVRGGRETGRCGDSCAWSSGTAAGGLGIIGGVYGDADWLDREFAAAGNSRVGCGFITWSLAKQPELLTHVLAHAPAVLMLSFGDPTPFAPAVRASGSRLICQVQTIAHTRAALDCGADIIVAQGSEAGGEAPLGRR